MHRCTTISSWIAWIVVCALSLPGCQSGSNSLQRGKTGGADFGNTWTTYKACRTSDDLQVVTQHADSLAKLMVAAPSDKSGIATESQSFRIASLFKANEPRLSANPQVMALDCWLHAGHLAASTGQHDLAYVIYSKVLRSPHTPENRYYLGVAQASLMSLHGSLRASHVPSSPYSPN